MIGRTNKLPFNPINWPAVPHDYTGDYNLGYAAVETTQRYAWGTRGMTWDGKVYRYGQARGTVLAGFGACNTAEIDVSDLLNTNFTVAIAPGDRSVTLVVTSTEGYDGGGLAEDELVGAQYVVGHGVAGGAATEQRTVIGNTAIAASTTGTVQVDVDMPFGLAHAAGFNELPMNPYGYLMKPDNTIASVMGVPIITAGDLYNLWIQTWGLCFCVPGGADANISSAWQDRQVYFTGDGSVNGGDILDHTKYQKAGFTTDASESGSMPMVMLQISI